MNNKQKLSVTRIVKNIYETRFGIALFAFAIVSVIYPSRAYAWKTNQSAEAVCKNNIVYVSASFENNEPQMDKYSMDITPTDLQSGKEGNTKTAQPGETVTWEINTGLETVNSGTVEFFLTWTDGSKGTDKRSANYNSIDCSPEDEPEDEPEDNPEDEPEDEPEDNPKEEPKIGEIKNKSVDLNKKVRFEGEDSWKDKITDVDKDDVIEFRIKITNTGNTSLNDLKMTDELPDELERVGGSGLTEYFSNLDTDEEKTFVIKARVKPEYLDEEKCVVNYANIKLDNDKKAEDSATVCYGDVEITELPETGAAANISFLFLGTTLIIGGISTKKYFSL